MYPNVLQWNLWTELHTSKFQMTTQVRLFRLMKEERNLNCSMVLKSFQLGIHAIVHYHDHNHSFIEQHRQIQDTPNNQVDLNDLPINNHPITRKQPLTPSITPTKPIIINILHLHNLCTTRERKFIFDSFLRIP